MNKSELSGKAEGLAEMLDSKALLEEQLLSIVGGTGDDDNASSVLCIEIKYHDAYQAAKNGGMSSRDALASVFNTLTQEEQEIYRSKYNEKMAPNR